MLVWNMPSFVEQEDMHFLYGFCNDNTRVLQREYQRRFPNRWIPTRAIFSRLHRNLRELVIFDGVIREGVWYNNVDKLILDKCHRNPETSIGRFTMVVGISYITVWQTAREEGLYLFILYKFKCWSKMTINHGQIFVVGYFIMM